MEPADRKAVAEAEEDRDINFERVLSGASAEKRTALIVFPIVVALVLIIGFAFVAISRMSGLSTQVQIAEKQVEEANKVVEQRDAQLRDAHSETAVLGSAGQGAAVMAAVTPDSGASGLALDHPEQHALALYAFNLPPAPEGQEYRLIVTDGAGQEQLKGSLTPNDRGAAFLLARDVPEGADRLEVALVPMGAGGAAGAQGSGSKAGEAKSGDAKAAVQAPPAGNRKPVLVGQLPRPGESGVVAAAPAKDSERGPGGRSARARRPR